MTDTEELYRRIAYSLAKAGLREVSRHLDEIGDEAEQVDFEQTLDYWSREFFPNVRHILLGMDETRSFVLVIPLSDSNRISKAVPEQFTKLKSVPTLYLTTEKNIFIEAHEEYRFHIDILSSISTSCVFRSWRDARSAKNGWEFNNAIYISE